MKLSYWVILPLLILTACASMKYSDEHYRRLPSEPACRDEKPLSWDETRALWRKEVEGYVFIFKPEPEFSKCDESVALELTIFQMRGAKSAPLEKASVGCRVHMPKLTGSVHFSKSYLECSETAPGVYRAKAVFTKAEEWEIDFNILTLDGKTIGVDFPFKVM